MVNMSWKWTRARGGWIAGVLEGLGRSYGVNPNFLRAVLVLSVLLFGAGIILYLVLAIILPVDDAVANYDRPQLFGVCYRVSRTTAIELPILRLGMVLGALFSLGLFLLIYFGLALYFYFHPEVDDTSDW